MSLSKEDIEKVFRLSGMHGSLNPWAQKQKDELQDLVEKGDVLSILKMVRSNIDLLIRTFEGDEEALKMAGKQ